MVKELKDIHILILINRWEYISYDIWSIDWSHQREVIVNHP